MDKYLFYTWGQLLVEGTCLLILYMDKLVCVLWLYLAFLHLLIIFRRQGCLQSSSFWAFGSSQTVICGCPFQPVVPDVPPQVIHLVIHCLFVFFLLLDQYQLLQKLEVFLLLLQHLPGWLKTTSLAPVDCSGDVVNPSEGRWNSCLRRKELGLRRRHRGNIKVKRRHGD